VAETIGSLVDKLSILELKLFYMKAQTRRPDAAREHQAACRKRWRVLKYQRNDLATELSLLLTNIIRGKARRKVYRQFKMYNDPAYRTARSG
jgi:hypothetical protein